MMSNENLANIARLLAEAMMKRARTRSTEDQKTVLELQTKLCSAVREEIPMNESQTR
jgi:hypothetical protein